jgi:hypothetical protein
MNAPLQIAPAGLHSTALWQARAGIAYPLLLLLAVALVIPANFGGPMLQDNVAINWVWADQFTSELAKGNIYPRLLPLSNAGLGAPVFYFYPPLAFYVAGVFGLLGVSTYASLIATYATAFAASGIGCWHWLKGRSNQPLLGAAFFMAAPYHLFDYTYRGATSESLAVALIPLIAIGLRRIAERRGGLVFTALAYGAIICTHLPLALLTSLFLIAPYALVHRQRLPAFASAVALGIALAAIYLLPAFALDGYRDTAQLYRSVDLRTGYWSIYSFNWVSQPYAIVFAIIAVLIVTAWRPAFRQGDGWARYAIAVAVIVTGIIPVLWSLPLLRDVQFPYRALPLAEFALATALARMPRNLSIASIAVPLLLSAWILPGFRLPGNDLTSLRARHPDVYEYLPKNVMKPGQTGTTLNEVLATRDPAPRVEGMVIERHFYFPSWSCGTVEPRTQLLMHKPDCTPHVVWTVWEKIGAAISAAAALLVALLALRNRREPREQSAALS